MVGWAISTASWRSSPPCNVGRVSA
jgi:hypothetical protein